MDSKKRPFDVIEQLASLRRYARSLVRNADEAEDLVHDALVKAYERRATFRPSGGLRTWLLSIVHNSHIDRIRAGRSQARRLADAAKFADHVSPPVQDHALRLAQVREAFFQLPPEQREALHLVAIEELSYQEAAEALSVPVGTLMSRISRARERLRAFEEGHRPPHLRIVGGHSHENE